MSIITKTSISTDKDIFDIYGQWLPKGNYYFCIHKFTDKTAAGYLYVRMIKVIFEFKMEDLVKMMSRSQSILSRRAGVTGEHVPTLLSPTISPISIPRNFIIRRNGVHTSPVNRSNSRESNGERSGAMCSVCLEFITSNERKLQCNHVFHRSCINRWLRSHITCPVCRAIVPRQHRTQRQRQTQIERRYSNPINQNQSRTRLARRLEQINTTNRSSVERRNRNRRNTVVSQLRLRNYT